MKNLVNQDGEETIYYIVDGLICETDNNTGAEISTDESGSFRYWNDGDFLFLYSDGKLWQFEEMEAFANFAEGKDIEPSDIFPEFTDDQFYAIAFTLMPSFEEMSDASLSGTNLEIMGNEYLFGTDAEMDELWDEYLDNYIDECILPEVPEAFQNYFDDEKWKSDAKDDGRAHSLASYDGHELSHGDYYFYRTN